MTMVRVKKKVFQEEENYDLDNLFVNSILSSGGKVLGNSIKEVPPDIVQGDEHEVYAFILDYYKRSLGQMPTKVAVKRKFPDFRLSNVRDDVSHFAKEMVTREKHNLFATYTTDMTNAVLAEDLSLALEKLRELNSKISDLEQIKDIELFSDFDTSVSEYEKLKENKGSLGLDCGIEFIDKSLGGLVDEMFIIMGRRGVGKCVDAESMVYCADGSYITIEQFVKEKRKYIYSYDEKSRTFVNSKVKGYVDSGYKQGYKVVLRSGRNVIVTKEHPFLLEDGTWQSLIQGLKVGSRITVPRFSKVEGGNILVQEQLEVIALLITEGCITRDINFSTADKYILNKAKKISKHFKCSLKHRSAYDYSFCVPKNSGKNPIMDYMRELGLYGHKAEDKFIPDIVFSCSNEQLVPFIEMMFNTDGSVDKKSGRVEYYSTSKKMIYQLQTILTRFGIYSNVIRKENEFLGVYILAISSYDLREFCKYFTLMPRKQKILYKLIKKKFNTNVLTHTLRDSDFELLSRNIKNFGVKAFTQKVIGRADTLNKLLAKSTNQKRMSLSRLKDVSYHACCDSIFNMSKNCIFDEIVSIECVGKRHMYDLEVQGSHNFVVNNIIVHNTWLELLLTKNLHPQIEGTVVIITNEISPTKMKRRLHALGAGIQYGRYRKGLLTDKEYNRFLGLRKIYGKRHPIIIKSGKGKSVDMLEYEIATLEPALLVVDGLYLQAQGFNDPFRDTLSASRAYQKLIGRLGIAGLFTTQANKDDETKYALAVEEDADIVMRMYQTPALETDKIMALEFTKVREDASNKKQYLNWDFDNWDFSHYDMDEPDVEAEEEFN